MQGMSARPMEQRDLANVLSWRNHPDVRSYMQTRHEITMREKNFFSSNAGIIELSDLELQDIDNEDDWKLAEYRFKNEEIRIYVEKNILPGRWKCKDRVRACYSGRSVGRNYEG
jgi:hypothetical protein